VRKRSPLNLELRDQRKKKKKTKKKMADAGKGRRAPSSRSGHSTAWLPSKGLTNEKKGKKIKLMPQKGLRTSRPTKKKNHMRTARKTVITHEQTERTKMRRPASNQPAYYALY